MERRIYEHRKSLNPKSFSSKYRLYKLIWFQEFATPQEAIEIEKKIKGFLVELRNPLLLNLDKKTLCPALAGLDSSPELGMTRRVRRFMARRLNFSLQLKTVGFI